MDEKKRVFEEYPVVTCSHHFKIQDLSGGSMSHYRYGAYGLVWTQLIADVCTVVVSYVVYFWVTRKMK